MRYIYWTTCLIIAASALTAATVYAQFGGVVVQGIEITEIIRLLGKHHPPREARIAGDDAAFSQQRICGELLQNRAMLEAQVRDLFRAAAQPILQKIGFGVHSESSANISSNCTAQADFLGVNTGRITVKSFFGGNKLNIRLTTPNGIPGHSIFGTVDPKLTITFDIEHRVVLLLPGQTPGSVTVMESKVTAMNVSNPSAGSITGSVFLAAKSIFELITGDDFTGQLRKNRVFFPNVDLPLGQINQALARIPGKRIESRVVGQNVRLFLTTEPPPDLHVH